MLTSRLNYPVEGTQSNSFLSSYHGSAPSQGRSPPRPPVHPDPLGPGERSQHPGHLHAKPEHQPQAPPPRRGQGGGEGKK